MNVDDSKTYTVEFAFSTGEKIMNPSNIEWFCVAYNTPIESDASAGDVVALEVVSTQARANSVSLKLSTLKYGNARIVGHVKKNPSSSMATNTDHVYSFIDVEVSGPTTAPTSNPSSISTSNPTSVPTSKSSSAPHKSSSSTSLPEVETIAPISSTG